MRRFIILLFPLVFLWVDSSAAQQHRFFVHVDSSHSDESPENLFERLGLRLVRTIKNGDDGIYVVSGDNALPPQVVRELLDSEPALRQIESVRRLDLSDTNTAARARARKRAETFAREQLRSSHVSPLEGAPVSARSSSVRRRADRRCRLGSASFQRRFSGRACENWTSSRSTAFDSGLQRIV